MSQLPIPYDSPLPESRQFDGATFEPAMDAERLGKQLVAVRDYMLACTDFGDGWRTLRDLSRRLGYPEASISARLRDLRKSRWGAYTVERKRVEGGLFAYKVSK